ncbi:arginase [Clostridium frigidicarnis]|uniref:Arginase n=1 Tax=Clostridium frigidicarnis TaxID=84698 RepID=A0A1I0ZA33_9CLOT|nr:arginase [Clostridium frigidicarnis]SFB22504.1 arginase [Clostridium frigidicarnis]
MNINLIGVPLYFGCDKKGVDLSPDILRNNGLIDILEKHNHKVFDLGNLHVKQMSEQDKFKDNKSMKYLSPVVELNNNLAQSVYCSLNSGYFPLVIGGDHALGLGSICGASKHFNNDLAVIWIDAHGDINTDKTTPSGNIHGMPLAAAMGLGNESLTDIYFNDRKVNPKNVYIIGARALDQGELDLMKEVDLKLWKTSEVKELGCEKIINDILTDLNKKGITNVHISYDIDSLDANIVPGTGTPVENGLNVDEVNYVLEKLLKSGLITSMDFVELNTKLDSTDQTLNVALELFNVISKSLSHVDKLK